MTRAIWQGVVLAAVTSAGVAWGQTAPPPAASQVVTLQSKGGLPEQCRVLKTWTTAKGQDAYLLQSLDCDETLTVVHTGGAGGGQVGVQIYRWANSIMPPPGSPVPPPDDGAALRQASHVTTAPEPLMAPLPITVPEAPAPIEAGPMAIPCAPRACEKDRSHCGYVHRYEKPPSLTFRPGGCLPVCAPDHCPNYGYHETRWRPWPGVTEAVPTMNPETASSRSELPHAPEGLLPAVTPSPGATSATGPAPGR
jgi:hypothetical protein